MNPFQQTTRPPMTDLPPATSKPTERTPGRESRLVPAKSDEAGHTPQGDAGQPIPAPRPTRRQPSVALAKRGTNLKLETSNLNPASDLARIQSGQSTANYATIITGLKAKGIPESDIIPRENVLTFKAWLALGRCVKKGEHGIKVVSKVPKTKTVTDPETGTTKEIVTHVRTVTATVFHISQTKEINKDDPKSVNETNLSILTHDNTRDMKLLNTPNTPPLETSNLKLETSTTIPIQVPDPQPAANPVPITIITHTSWKMEVCVDNSWSSNSCRYATEKEAIEAGKELLMRWFAPTDSRAVPSTDPVNYTFNFEQYRPEPIAKPTSEARSPVVAQQAKPDAPIAAPSEASRGVAQQAKPDAPPRSVTPKPQPTAKPAAKAETTNIPAWQLALLKAQGLA